MPDIEYTEPCAPKGLTSPRYGDKTEHRIVRKLILTLKAEGFTVHSVAVEREIYVMTPTCRAAVCEVFEYDAYVTLRFKRTGETSDTEELFGALLVAGNGTDIVSDHTWDAGDSDSSNPTPGTFAAAMAKFYDSIP